MSQKLAFARAQLLKLGAAPEDLRQSDPTAITWAYINGRFVTDNSRKTHSEMILEKVKSKEIGSRDLAAISSAALGRSKADGSVVAIWANEPESLGGAYHEAIDAAMAQGLATPNGTIVFSDGKSMPMAEWSARSTDVPPTREGLPSKFQEDWYSEPEAAPTMAWVSRNCKFAAMEKTVLVRKKRKKGKDRKA